MIVSAHPASTGGAYRDRHGRGKRDAVDVRMLSVSCADESILADGEIVRSRSPDAEIKSADDSSSGDGGYQARYSGESAE